MNFAYLSCDGFFNLIDEIPCPETKILVETMIETLRASEQLALDIDYKPTTPADAVRITASIFQEALEDYLINRSRQQEMVERPPSNPERN